MGKISLLNERSGKTTGKRGGIAWADLLRYGVLLNEKGSKESRNEKRRKEVVVPKKPMESGFQENHLSISKKKGEGGISDPSVNVFQKTRAKESTG